MDPKFNIDLLPNLEDTDMENFLKEGFPTQTKDPEDKVQDIQEPLEEIKEVEDADEFQKDEDETAVVDDSKEDINKIWLSYAKEQGWIDYKDEDYKPEEGEEFVKNKYQETLETRVKEKLEEKEQEYPEVIKQLLTNYREGVPLMDLIESETRMTDYQSIKDEHIKDNLELQKEIISSLYTSQEYSEEEINSKLQKLEDSGLIEDEAKISLKKLIKLEEKHKASLIEESKKKEEQRKREVLEGTENFRKAVMETKELFPGIPYTEEMKKKNLNAILKPVKKINGHDVNMINLAQQEDPLFLQKLAFMVTHNWDISTFENAGGTKATKKLKESVNTYKEKETKLNSMAQVAQKWAAAKRRKY